MMPQAASLGAHKEYRVASKEQFFAGAGFGPAPARARHLRHLGDGGGVTALPDDYDDLGTVTVTLAAAGVFPG